MGTTRTGRLSSSQFQLTSEKQLQTQVVYLLKLLGYTVMETGKSRSKQKCKACGAMSYATGWQGNTAGLPDLYIHSSKWPTALAVAIELKTQTGTVRKEQQELYEKGLSSICRSITCVLNALLRIETLLNNSEMIEKIERTKEVNGY